MTGPLVLDCRGMRCPLPVIELARRIDEVAVGEVVEVWATDPAARPDIAAWCRLRGQTYLGETTAEPNQVIPPWRADPSLAYRVRRER